MGVRVESWHMVDLVLDCIDLRAHRWTLTATITDNVRGVPQSSTVLSPLHGAANHAWASPHNTYIGNVGAAAVITMNGWVGMPELHLYNAASINVNGNGLDAGQIYVEDSTVCIIRGNNAVVVAGQTPNKSTDGGASSFAGHAAGGGKTISGPGFGGTSGSGNAGGAQSGTAAGGGGGGRGSSINGVGGLGGGGIVDFAAQQDYTGGTTIDSGTLLANHATQSTGAGAVTVKDGGTLGGSGAIVGAVTVESGGHLAAAGANAVGTLTLSADNTSLNVNDGAVLDYEISGSDASPASDLIDLTGTDSTIAFGSSATLNVSRLTGQTINPIGKTFVLFQYTGAAPTLPTTWTINYSNPLWTGGSVQLDGQTIVLTGVSMLENHAPTDIALAPSTVAENSAMGTVIGTLSTTDENVGDAFTYTLVAGDGDGDNALVAIDSDALKVNGALSHASNPTLEIRVQTEDSGTLTFSKALVITVTENDSPRMVAAGSVAPGQTLVGTVKAVDPNPEDTLIYSVSGGANADLFELVGDVLSMKAAPLPGDLGNVYYVEVQVSDGMATDRMLIEVTVSTSAPADGTIFIFK